ncbi:MAG: InlB B-repeat-containing protein [Anaeroplasmataceae bacterium]|nr:InlB B-repeat-containing protein [Anaeroplasmataceae bacterium]
MTIDLNDGATPTTKDVIKGEKLTGVSEPTRDGYTFAGWKANGEDWTMETAITADITIVAQWTSVSVPPVVEKYNISFEMHGHGSAPKTLTDQTALPSPLPSVEDVEGWHFEGWYLDAEYKTLAVAGTAITSATTLHAKWEEVGVPPVVEKYNISFNMHDHGEAPEALTDQTALPNPLPSVEDVEGWHFEGWYLDAEYKTIAVAGAAITSATTLHAKWEEVGVPPVVEKYNISFNMHNHGEAPEALTDQTTLPNPLPSVVDVEGWHFEGWYLDAEYKTPAEAGTDITADVVLHAKWYQLTPYEEFVSKGNIIYASDFTNLEEVILNSNSIQNSDEAYGKWMGTINDYDDFDDKNKVFIQNGYLNVVDESSKTTYANLMLTPVYASVIEVKAVIQTSTTAGSWSIFTLMSPYSSSEFLLNLRTNSAKEICLQTRVYNPTKKEYEDSQLSSGGFAFVENKDLVIEAIVDLSTGEITVTLSQEGKTKTLTAAINTEGYMEVGLPLAFSGVKVMTAGAASRSIKMDWLGARIVSENLEALKKFILDQFEKDYESYDKSEYTQQIELLEKVYADGVAAIEAATTNMEALLAMNDAYEALYAIRSDEELEAEAMVEEALQELAELKEEYKDFYTITRDSEEDWYANKESFDELFANAISNLEHPSSVEFVQGIVASVRNALTEENSWLQNDGDVLKNYRQYLVHEVRTYGYENGYSNSMAQVEEEIITPFEEDLAALNTKAEMKALYAEYIELFDLIETDEQILATAKQKACSEVEEYAELALADLDEALEIDAELISLIGTIKDNALLAINNATEQYGPNGVEDIKNAAMDEIGDLAELAGFELEEIILWAQLELEAYINQMKSRYQEDEEEVLAALDQVYTDHENDFDELTTVTAVRDELKELQGRVDGIVAADQLKKDKVWYIEIFEEMAANQKQSISSVALQKEFDAIKDVWVEELNNAASNEVLMNLFEQGNQALDDFLNEIYNRKFKVTFTNAVGYIYVNYDQFLIADSIHVTGMVVTGYSYNDEEINDNSLRVYDDLAVTLVMEAIDVDLDFVEWKAANNNGASYGIFADTEFFTLSEDIEFAWLEASFSSDYNIGWQSGNFATDGSGAPILLQIKENLSSLKLHIGLADSKWSSGRTGVITFIKNGTIIKELSDENKNVKLLEEVILENLECGDVIEIIAQDLNSGSRIYIFDAEAHLDYDAVPKTVAIIWGDAEEPTMYSHLEAVKAPEEDPVGEGAFKYWYYIDAEGQEVVFDENEENYFESTTEPIHMLPYFAQANVHITYINGDDEEVVPYSLGDDEMGIEKKFLLGSSTEKFIGWFEEDATEEFDYASVEAGTEVTLYAKWHDLGTKTTEESKLYDYTKLTALPETDSKDKMIEYAYSGETLEKGKGIKTSNEAKDSRYIKVNLPTAGKIIVVFDNTTTNVRTGFIDTTPNKTNETSSYGHVSIGKSNANDHHVTLTSSDLAAGTYYVNWTGKGIIIESIKVIYEVETEVEYTGISGTPVTAYTAGSGLDLDLSGLTLNTTDGDAIALETIKADLSIDIENEADFQAGLAGSYDVSITYGNHSKINFTITVEEPAE